MGYPIEISDRSTPSLQILRYAQCWKPSNRASVNWYARIWISRAGSARARLESWVPR
jgi:hypothetical protein